MLEKMKQRKEQRGEGGFTLIELLIVIIILAILAAIVVFAVGTTGKNAAVAACQSTVKSVETAVEAYKAQVGVDPTAITQLTGTTVLSGGTTVGPWLRQAPNAKKYKVSLGGSGTVLVNGSNADAATSPCTSVS